MSISDYFSNAIDQIKNEIEQSSEAYLLNIDAGELAEYYAEKYSLPLIERDENREIKVEKKKSRYGQIPIDLCYPIVPMSKFKARAGLQEVIRRRSKRDFVTPLALEIRGAWLVTHTEMRSLKTHVENLNKVVGWKNDDVRVGNKRLRDSTKTYIESKQKIIKKEYEQLETFIEKVEVPLVVKREEMLPIVDFSVKEELEPLTKPESKKQKELVLDRSKVITLMDYIRNSCLSFERTPEVFSELEEEHLRNIILGNLNAIFKGEATSETFSKLGKTDISLRVSEGNILIIECKYWKGEAKYIDGIDQLFRYLTWRQNYGIIVTFSRRRHFTSVLRNAQEASQEHKTFISDSIVEQREAEFATKHTFPDDVEKNIEIHHLLFNLFTG